MGRGASESTLSPLSSQAGTVFTGRDLSQPSDSFPGLMAMVTGGTPKTTGVFYDDSYARNMWAPGSNCAGAPGAEKRLRQKPGPNDRRPHPLFASPIDPANLPLGKVDGRCVPSATRTASC